MRTTPKIKLNGQSDNIAKTRFDKITRIVAIAFVLIVQIAIIYKMLL
jgi:hypothetical protein